LPLGCEGYNLFHAVIDPQLSVIAPSRTRTTVAAEAKPKKRGGITAAGRKKLSEAMKKRWAERKRKDS
jgi:hypothetical protein